jgi:hypothetical protein
MSCDITPATGGRKKLFNFLIKDTYNNDEPLAKYMIVRTFGNPTITITESVIMINTMNRGVVITRTDNKDVFDELVETFTHWKEFPL